MGYVIPWPPVTRSLHHEIEPVVAIGKGGLNIPAGEIGHPGAGAIWLRDNGETRQEGDLSQLIRNVAETIFRLSRLAELRPGDLIFTGPPDGVAAVERGDRLEGHVDGVGALAVTIGE